MLVWGKAGGSSSWHNMHVDRYDTTDSLCEEGVEDSLSCGSNALVADGGAVALREVFLVYSNTSSPSLSGGVMDDVACVHHHSKPGLDLSQELCSLAKHLQPTQRAALFAKLTQLGLHEVLTMILRSGSSEAQVRATDVLLSVLAHDPVPLRAHFVSERDTTGGGLLGLLVGEVVAGGDDGLPEQISELLKLLLDPETMEGAIEKNEFLEVFYSKHMSSLLEAIVAGGKAATHPATQPEGPGSLTAHASSQPGVDAGSGDVGADGKGRLEGASSGNGKLEGGEGGGGVTSPSPTVMRLIVDLLCFCVQHHGYRCKFYMIRWAHGLSGGVWVKGRCGALQPSGRGPWTVQRSQDGVGEQWAACV